jgi:hypothetical protein
VNFTTSIEQAVWLAPTDLIDVEHLPETVRRSAETVLPMRERRTQVSDQLYAALVTAGYSFWDHIYPLFLSRDITRHDMRELVRRGLATTRGNYRALLKLFGMAPQDYKRFLNFLAAHDCRADFREFRNGVPDVPRRPHILLAAARRESCPPCRRSAAPNASRSCSQIPRCVGLAFRDPPRAGVRRRQPSVRSRQPLPVNNRAGRGEFRCATTSPYGPNEASLRREGRHSQCHTDEDQIWETSATGRQRQVSANAGRKR